MSEQEMAIHFAAALATVRDIMLIAWVFLDLCGLRR